MGCSNNFTIPICKGDHFLWMRPNERIEHGSNCRLEIYWERYVQFYLTINKLGAQKRILANATTMSLK